MRAAVQLRSDFLGDDLRRAARKSDDADQTRRLLALAVSLMIGHKIGIAATHLGQITIKQHSLDICA